MELQARSGRRQCGLSRCPPYRQPLPIGFVRLGLDDSCALVVIRVPDVIWQYRLLDADFLVAAGCDCAMSAFVGLAVCWDVSFCWIDSDRFSTSVRRLQLAAAILSGD
jgi:hypothetical protein